MRNLAGPASYWTPDGFFIEDLFAAVEHGPVYADRQLIVARASNPPDLRLAGEIDMTNSSAAGGWVRIAIAGMKDPHLNVSDLNFCDVGGVRALLKVAQDLEPGARLVLLGVPAQLMAMLHATRFSDLPNLDLTEPVGAESNAMPLSTFSTETAAALTLAFGAGDLFNVRGEVAQFATQAGLPASRATRFVTAVNEVATNSVVHGGGSGIIRVWLDSESVITEIRDHGAFDQTGAGRVPPVTREDARGLWVANQLCDRLLIRRIPGGTAVRLRMEIHQTRSF